MKKSISFLLSFILIISSLVTSPIHAITTYKTFGDLDGDQKVTLSDLVTMARCLLKDIELTPEQALNADIDEDGSVQINDYASIKQYVMGDTVINVGTTKAIETQTEEIYYAVDAELNKAFSENINVGFTGTAYINYENVLGSSITWTVNAPETANYKLIFNYANGTATNRFMNIHLNNSENYYKMDFNQSGTWTDWTQNYIVVSLNKGENKINVISATENGGPNIDYLKLETTTESTSPITIYETPITTAVTTTVTTPVTTTVTTPIITPLVYNFDFGNNGVSNGYIGVAAETQYNKTLGYGFSTPANIKNVSASGSGALSDAVQFVTFGTNSTNTFNVDLPPAVYEISVTLGNTNRTSVAAEGVYQIMNMTGNNAFDKFQIPVTDGQLNILATAGKDGYAYTLSSLKIEKISDNTKTKPIIWLCGDSTVCNYYPLDTSVQAGWGQVLNKYIDTSKYMVRNIAASGQYAKGFVDAGQFDTIMKYIKPGDYYFISIGINDTNYSTADEYYTVVKNMTQKAKSAGATVILVKQQGRATDITANPNLTGRWFGTQLDKIGSEEQVQVIDLFKLAFDYFKSIGQDATTALYMSGDTLHPNRAGTEVLAKLVTSVVDFNQTGSVPVVVNKNAYSSFDNSATPTIYIAGDSTVQSYRESYAPQQGWGFYLNQYLNTNVTVSNHALAGRSSKSFYDNGRLDTILSSINKGDYLLVQFGINDAAYGNAERYAPVCGSVTNPTEGSFEFYMTKYIKGALDKQATPVLVTTVIGLKAYSNGKFVNSYDDYCKAMKDLATYYQIPCIDLNTLMVDFYNSVGYERAKLFHLYGVVSGSTDMTHFSEEGANEVAKLLASKMKTTDINVSKYVK